MLLLALALLAVPGAEFDLHVARGGDVAFDVVGIEIPAQAGQGDEPIQRATVEQVPAHVFGDPAADGALARTRRSVDGDDGDV